MFADEQKCQPDQVVIWSGGRVFTDKLTAWESFGKDNSEAMARILTTPSVVVPTKK
jgi:hypothetical protein